jgi:hypothetical protein
VLVTAPGRLRAPEQSGAVLAEPPLERAGDWIAANRDLLRKAPVTILGRNWVDLRQDAGKAALEAARTYLAQAGEPLPAFQSESLLLAGHQPELFHPGVWVKNFALQGLAVRHGLTPLNLVVDNDTAKSTVLRLPDLTSAPDAHVASVPFDHWAGEVPYEERAVQDEELFATLPERAAGLLRSWNFQPLLSSYWQEVRRQASRTPLLGERLAAGRRTFERLWGCHNLEVPVSSLCRTEPFAWFACQLLANLPRFHGIYNASVHAYRRLHGLRSRNHPVPDLAAANGWLEVPFWAWQSGQQQRGRLLARRDGAELELAVQHRQGQETWPRLPLQPAAAMVHAYQGLEQRGLKIRSRALTNTLFARLFVADLFMHGIGGAKYDELTDEIIRQFYGLEPPGYLVLSATLLLPLPVVPARRETCRALARYLRDLHYNPQRHLDGEPLRPEARALAREKADWIARQPNRPEQKRQRFQALRDLTARLRPAVAGAEHRLAGELVDCEQQLQASAVSQRRDYAFCLYPEAQLRAFCTRFLHLSG